MTRKGHKGKMEMFCTLLEVDVLVKHINHTFAMRDLLYENCTSINLLFNKPNEEFATMIVRFFPRIYFQPLMTLPRVQF